MKNRSNDSSLLSRQHIARRMLSFGAAFVGLVSLLPLNANAQTLPAEAYGPYNATFLVDGPGLSKPLTPPSSIDPRTAAMLDRMGMGNRQSDSHEALVAGHAAWTLAFWFRPSEALTGTVLLTGIGDPGGEDARFIGIEDGHIGLWLGRGQGSSHLVASKTALAKSEWHLAVAVSNGDTVTLYADGVEAVSSPLTQGAVAARLEMAPAAIPSLKSLHFGGQIAALQVFRESLTAAQIKASFVARPDFGLANYEEATHHWPVQTSSMVGLTAPQDPSTLPRGKGDLQKPTAKPMPPDTAKLESIGDRSWRIRGGWKLAAEPDILTHGDKASGEALSKPGVATKNWLAATVPGTVLTTMIDRGLYPDPDYGLNNLAIPERLAHQDYWYRVAFAAPPQSRGQHLTLTFEGVNYAAEVWLNGSKLGGFTGAFIRGNFDVTSLLAAENVLAVRVSPPTHPGIAHEQSIKAGPGDNGGIQVIDGPTFSATEGWDWIPGIRDRNTGIWQDVTLTATGAVEVGDLNVITTLPKPDRSEADIEIEAPLTNTGNAPVEGDLTASFDDVKVTKHMRLEPGETIQRLKPEEFAQLKVSHPKLWWPNGYGDPTLHTLKVSFTQDGKISGQKQIEFGMRELSYETSLFDATGHIRRVEVLPSRTHDDAMPLINETHEGIRQIEDQTPNLGQPVPEYMRHAWVHSLAAGAEGSPSIRPVEGGWPGTDLVVKVNGVRIAARGGNWGMDDSRKRVSIEHLEPYFRLHRDAHVNMIRDWMGQDSEENFYALADKYGLMVWNDFWESTQGYNIEAQDPGLFLANARDSILHFRHHPSIVVWCGRNEGVPQPIINEGLANLTRTLDHTRYYTGSSNQVNLRNSGPYQLQTLDTYYKINRGFSVELGIPSVPTLESIEAFIPEPDRWPISDTWAYHDWHQSGNGDVAPFMTHLETEFGAATSLEDFERKAQMIDYAAHRAIFEGFAAHLWQPNSGRMIWMTQPAWPSMEWNFLSSDYDTQSSFFGTQKACEPVHAQLNLADNSVDLINLGDSRSFKVEVRVVSLDGKVLSDQTNQIEAAANNRTPVGKPDLDKLAEGHTVLVVLKVTDAAGAPVSDNLYWWAKDEASLRELNSLPGATLTTSATVAADGAERKATVKIANSGSAPALMVKLTLKDAATGARILPAYYSENYVSLLPGEERTITVEYPDGQGKPAIGLRGWNLATQTVAAP